MSKTLSRKSVLGSKADRILGASAAAIAAVTGAGFVGTTSESQADIVYSGVVNINIPFTTQGVYLNVATGVNATTPAGAPGWDLNPWSATGLSYFNPAAPAGGVYVQRTGGGATANLPFGSVIGAGSAYGAGAASLTGNEAHVAPGDNIVGFRFQNEGNGNSIHFGWMRIRLTGNTLGNSGGRTIVDYAYESAPGVDISAGAIPEPGTFAALALGAMGLVARRRRS
jgi:hypothetical protein